MTLLLNFAAINPVDRHLVGGKALALAELLRRGILIPKGLCLTTAVYRDYVAISGLATRISLELGRQPLAEMRWEEIWDIALRIRNLFLVTPLPEDLRQPLLTKLTEYFGDSPVAVRSSSPHEDQAGASFAGLHDSYVNIRGVEAILYHIRLVWASLWSDGALLYRHELKLTRQNSAMAVIIQELVAGERSGVAFSVSPSNAEQGVVEAVYGLNQGLVDGTISPDRWFLDRQSGTILSHTAAERGQAIHPEEGAVVILPLSEAEKAAPPLAPADLQRVFALAMNLERIFSGPQDVEWTIRGNSLYVLQSRPITTGAAPQEDQHPWSAADKRPWYLSLKRSFANLTQLHQRIENELLPQMAAEARQLAKTDLTRLANQELIAAIKERLAVHHHWVDVYWRDFIPFAHGARLFGQIYNDLHQPENPYSFTDLLADTEMTSLARNRDLRRLARMIRSDRQLRDQLSSGETHRLNQEFSGGMEEFLQRYDDLTFKAVRFFGDRAGLIALLLEMAGQEETEPVLAKPDIHTLGEDFVSRFPKERQDFARKVLAIGRASYQLRDNDNIVLAQIEAQLLKAVEEARRRIVPGLGVDLNRLTPLQVMAILADPASLPAMVNERKTIDEPVEGQGRPGLTPPVLTTTDGDFVMRARQLIGQPAGQGLAVGPARVILTVEDIFQFKAGEILVCDSVDPNMTFVVPLAAAIVERRGGMLVHGAIIAREYGLPCITGVTEATSLIITGDHLIVDGYLGIVSIDRGGERFPSG